MQNLMIRLMIDEGRAKRDEVNRLTLFMASCNLIRSLKQFINLFEVAGQTGRQTDRHSESRKARDTFYKTN